MMGAAAKNSAIRGWIGRSPSGGLFFGAPFDSGGAPA